MSTPLGTPQPQLMVRKYRKNWKSRATYGLVLKTKLEYLMALFEQAASKPTIILDDIINLSKCIDNNIAVQLSNITKIEEFTIMEAWERYLATTQRTPEGLRLEATAFR